MTNEYRLENGQCEALGTYEAESPHGALAKHLREEGHEVRRPVDTIVMAENGPKFEDCYHTVGPEGEVTHLGPVSVDELYSRQ